MLDASRYAEIKDELQGVNNELKVQKEAFEENQAAVKDNQKVIADYNKLTEAVMSGSTEEINRRIGGNTKRTGYDFGFRVESSS